jgi:tetratricopeptide (TPR) repeat protein
VLKRIYRGLVNAVHIDRAFAASLESRNQDALEILNRRVRDADHLYYVRLLKGHLYEKSGRFEDALEAFIAAHNLISESTQLTGREKAYFETFAAVAARRCAERLPKGALPPDVEGRLRVRFDEIDLRKMPGRIKGYFPIPEHPEWPHERGSDRP